MYRTLPPWNKKWNNNDRIYRTTATILSTYRKHTVVVAVEVVECTVRYPTVPVPSQNHRDLDVHIVIYILFVFLSDPDRQHLKVNWQ